MNPALLAVSPGPYVTVQDSGRRGWRRFGVAGAGAMDIESLHLANLLVGNEPDAASLEFAHVGGTWEIAAETCRIAIAGGDFAVSADGVSLKPWRSHTLRRRQRLSIASARDAVWGYLAVAGGFDIAPRFGSAATHLRSGLGGFHGRRIGEGDALPLLAAQSPTQPERLVTPPLRATGPLRVVPGPQEDYFAPDAIEAFFGSVYQVTHRADRMGIWLEGPKIPHAHGFNVLSDGLVPGCIQIPGAGQPVVLMKDCQTIGGYPKLAAIIAEDQPRFAQMRPGSQVSFRAIGIEAAHRLYRDYSLRLASAQTQTVAIARQTAWTVTSGW